MIECINKILKKAARSKAGKNDKIPSKILENEEFAMEVIVKLLEPCAALTDCLQGDYVTSSLVLPGLVSAIEGKSIYNLIGITTMINL